MTTPLQNVHVELDNTTYERLRTAALEEGLSVEAVALAAIRDHLEHRETGTS